MGLLLLASASDVDSLDPGAMYYKLSWFLARGVFRTLVTYASRPDAHGRAGLVPDLARDVGTANADLTEWRFQLRGGSRYGPAAGGRAVPSVTGREVESGDVKYAIERAFLESVSGPCASYYEVLEGARAFAAGDAADIRGIETPDPRTVVFRLTEPAGDWPWRLTLPAAAPVPREYARRFDGQAPSSYGRHAVASGPFYVARWEPGARISLFRNRWWEASSDAVRTTRIAAVDWRIGIGDEAIQEIVDGRLDLALDIRPKGRRLAEVESDDVLRERLVSAPSACTGYVFVNTATEPFADRRVREAVTYAIDRARLKEIQGGPLTGPIATSVIPPGVSGHLSSAAYSPFGTPGMRDDMGRAKGLMAAAGYPEGYPGRATVVGASDPPLGEVTDSVCADLVRLGFTDVSVAKPRFPKPYTEHYAVTEARIHVGAAALSCEDYADGYAFLKPLFHGGSLAGRTTQNYARLADSRLDWAIDHAGSLPLGPARDRALEAANRLATESCAWVPWSWEHSIVLHAERLIDPIYNPALGHIDWIALAMRA